MIKHKGLRMCTGESELYSTYLTEFDDKVLAYLKEKDLFIPQKLHYNEFNINNSDNCIKILYLDSIPISIRTNFRDSANWQFLSFMTRLDLKPLVLINEQKAHNFKKALFSGVRNLFKNTFDYPFDFEIHKITTAEPCYALELLLYEGICLGAFFSKEVNNKQHLCRYFSNTKDLSTIFERKSRYRKFT